MGEAIKHAFSGVTIDSFVAKIQTGFSGITESMAALRTAFDFTSSTVKFFFNTFTGVVKGFATAYTGMMYGIVRVWQETADALGFDGIAEKLKGTTDFLGGLTKEFARQTVADAKDATDALSGVYDSFAEVSEAGVKKANDTVKTMTKSNKLLWQNYADELVEGQKKVEEASAETAEAVKANFKDAADAISQVNTTETRTELASLGVALAEAFSQGTLSAEEYYQATEASREKLADLKAEAKDTRDAIKDTGDTAEKAGKQQAEALENATSIAGVMAGHYNGITAELQGMSSAAHDTFVTMQKGVGGINTNETIGSIEELKNELKETNQEISDLRHSALTTFDPTGISRWMNETAADAAHVKAKFLEQKIALEELFESYEQGNLTSRTFVRQAEKAAESMDLLNEQDLAKLNNAIVSAQQNMANLGESSRNTLEGLQNELDQLKGKQDEVERWNYEAQKRELKAELEEAKEKGDSTAIQNPVEQSTERSLTGALLVQEGQLVHGRSIVLSGNGEAGWVSRLTVKSLFALSKAANKTMTLTLPDNRQFSVIFAVKENCHGGTETRRTEKRFSSVSP
ncbi:hypothetical protein ACTL6P_12955 [Endozoicomonas acroporae]|uniref:hypothetical protein n=1 Tax=Endozoicomonas acroporae TaxID=1701104 RepID=UPI000C75B55D|nr:hypothetical protein [Endozoicomonas acroporae]